MVKGDGETQHYPRLQQLYNNSASPVSFPARPRRQQRSARLRILLTTLGSLGAQRAAAIGGRVRREDGAGAASALLERLVKA
jgi:hypothetical protein